MSQKDCSGTVSLDSAENITMVFPESSLEKTQCTNSMFRLLWPGFIALCAYVSFCLPLNQAYLCKGYLCKWKCCCSKEHRRAVKLCIEFLAGINPRPWCFVQRVPSLWVRNMMESRDSVCHQKECTIWSLNYKKCPKRCVCICPCITNFCCLYSK